MKTLKGNTQKVTKNPTLPGLTLVLSSRKIGLVEKKWPISKTASGWFVGNRKNCRSTLLYSQSDLFHGRRGGLNQQFYVFLAQVCTPTNVSSYPAQPHFLDLKKYNTDLFFLRGAPKLVRFVSTLVNLKVWLLSSDQNWLFSIIDRNKFLLLLFSLFKIFCIRILVLFLSS